MDGRVCESGDIEKLRVFIRKERDAEQRDRYPVVVHALGGKETLWFAQRLGRSRAFVQRSVFADVREAEALAASWRYEYTHQRPHSSLGYTPPAAFAAACRHARPLRLAPLACVPSPACTRRATLVPSHTQRLS